MEGQCREKKSDLGLCLFGIMLLFCFVWDCKIVLFVVW